MEAIEEELSKKSIERDDDNVSINIVEVDPVAPAVKPQVAPLKTKKVRSEKQIAAFEKARQTRAKNIALKKEQKTQQKAELKEQKKVIKQKVQQELSAPAPSLVQQQPSIPKPIQHPSVERIQAREQVVNNYYYYTTPHEDPHYEVERKKNRRSKQKKLRPPTPSSSEESSEEEDIKPPSPPIEPQAYKDLQDYNEPVKRPTPTRTKYKFSYA